MKTLRKIKKKPRHHWQRLLIIAMLWALCFGIQAVAAGNETRIRELEATLKEARLALREAKRENDDLETALSQTRKKLRQSRQKRAVLASQCRDQLEELTELRLRAAHLLSPSASGQQMHDIALMSEMLLASFNQRKDLKRLLVELEDHLSAIFETLNPSAALRREISDRLNRMQRVVDHQEWLPPEVAGRGSSISRLRRKARILAVNDELDLVIIDAGNMHGVRSGSTWHVMEDGKVLGLLKVIAIRSTLSAAVPVEGKFERLTPGLVVRLSLENDTE